MHPNVLLTFCVLTIPSTELYWLWQSGHVIDGSESDGSSTELIELVSKQNTTFEGPA